jgi:predicted RNA-binding Zn ribbon-like protein
VEGESLPTTDLDEVNRVAAGPDLPPSLDAEGAKARPAQAPIGEILSTIARDAIDLLAHEDPRRVRECAAEDCSLLFHDASRPGSRRWCSMAGCGNRAKTTRYRSRHAVSR